MLLAGGLVGCAVVAVGVQLSGPVARASQAVHLRETECRDVVDGAARYERDRVADGLPIADADYPQQLEEDGGRLRAVLRLAAPSCSRVDYLLHVFHPDGSLLTSRVVSGVDGLEQVTFDLRLENHVEDCLAVQFVTRVGDVVVDRAPDALTTYDTVCDGGVGEVAYR